MKAKKHRKVRDPCHYIGECRGAAHTICDLKHSVPKKNFMNFHKVLFYPKKVTRKI